MCYQETMLSYTENEVHCYQPYALLFLITIMKMTQYFWLTKDLAWNQGYFTTGVVFGAFAIAWSIGIVARALYHRSISESVTGIAQRMLILD